MYSGNLSNIESVIEEWKYRLLNSISAASVIPFLYLIKNRYYIHNLKSADKTNKIFICIFSCFEMVSLTIAFFIACKDSIFKSIYMTYFYYSLFSIPFLLSFLGDGFPYINKKAVVALFKNEGKLEKIDYCFIFLYLLILFMFTLNNYSKNIFPNISSNMGGGYYKYNTIILNDERVINGKIIHSNKDYLFISDEEGKIQQYSVSEIKEYLFSEKKQKEENQIIVQDKTKETFSKIKINIKKEFKKMESLISAIIAAVISAIVSIFITSMGNKFTQKKDLDNQLDSILKLAFDHPELETISETKKWKDVDKTTIESQRYELYATMVFNYLERVCKFYKYKTSKIEKYLDVKSWVRIHKEYWEHPTVEHENQDVYEKKFRDIINSYIK